MKASLAFLLLVVVFAGGCKNPFAPDVEFRDNSSSTLIADNRTTDGIFKNIQNAYTFRDTLIYGGLLDQSFAFTYRDYDLGYDVTWGRTEEMRITVNLFQNSERLDLIWNNTISTTYPDSLNVSIIRGFNLTITFNPADVIRVDGRVNLQMHRADTGSRWYITRWIDESNF